MALDFKGLTEKEVQEQIDWIIQQREFDKMMWKMHAQDIVQRIVLDSMTNHDKNKMINKESTKENKE